MQRVSQLEWPAGQGPSMPAMHRPGALKEALALPCAQLASQDHALLRYVVGALALPVLLLGDHLAVRNINFAARRRLLCTGLSPQAGDWMRWPPELQASLVRRFAQTGRIEWGHWSVGGPQGELPVGLLPLNSTAGQHGLALMLVPGTQERGAGLVRDLFCRTHGLTDGKCRVLDALCSGLTPRRSPTASSWRSPWCARSWHRFAARRGQPTSGAFSSVSPTCRPCRGWMCRWPRRAGARHLLPGLRHRPVGRVELDARHQWLWQLARDQYFRAAVASPRTSTSVAVRGPVRSSSCRNGSNAQVPQPGRRASPGPPGSPQRLPLRPRLATPSADDRLKPPDNFAYRVCRTRPTFKESP